MNNAGWDAAMNFLDSEPELRRKLIDINLVGPLNVTKAVLSRMLEQGSGRVVSIASDAGRVGSSGESVYAACKGGIIAFTKSVAREMAWPPQRSTVHGNGVTPLRGPTEREAPTEQCGMLTACGSSSCSSSSPPSSSLCSSSSATASERSTPSR